jgi:hypothetical protein
VSDLARLNPRDLYDAPHMMGEAIHRIEAVIAAAAALQRWDDLEKAVDFLIECPQVILRWWDDHVQDGRPKVSQDRGILSSRAAQEQRRRRRCLGFARTVTSVT